MLSVLTNLTLRIVNPQQSYKNNETCSNAAASTSTAQECHDILHA